ncbi:MAG: hypothetical protein MJ123_05300 [Lachnospiraceae bacterium]|nr:hypothetical protein [Lachnospiraceae bacterium]
MLAVAHNLTAMNAQRQYGITEGAMAKSTEKLSSGFRINRAADDAAGLAISEKMRRQIRGLNQGSENIQSGISMVQVADGALAEVHDMLNRATELSVKAANDTLNAEDRQAIQSEINGIVSEIQRISDDTSYNEIKLFNDPDYYMQYDGLITKLVHCPSAETGRLSEAYQKGALYYPAAYVNFDGINSANLDLLNGGNFAFHCSQSCGEVFDITFTTDGTPSSASNLSPGAHHKYSVDISGCKNGTEIVDKIYDYVSNNLPSLGGSPQLSEGVMVSHSNNLIKDGNRLVVARNYSPYATSAAAKDAYKFASGNSGKITCSTIESDTPEMLREFNIQCSSEIKDVEKVTIYRMNTEILGIDTLDVTTFENASNAIDTVKNAGAMISRHRSNLGADQNRLEHSLNINGNVSENTTAAESAIRDTDMAKEMVNNSLLTILSQAGTSMMAQSNQSNQGVLSLLQ